MLSDHLLSLFDIYLEPLWPYVWRVTYYVAPVLVFVFWACCSVSGRCSRAEEEAIDNETCIRPEI